jgi:hypothetical protein
MKTRCGVVLWAAMFLLTHIVRADNSDLNITVEKKRIEQPSDHALKKESGDETKKSEQWGYTVTIENQGFKALSNLQVKYIIYSKHEQLGIKGPPRKATKTGDYTITSLDSLGKTSFDTDSVKLNHAALVGPMGGYSYFGNGAKPTADDSLTGIWIRVYQGGNLFAEYAYPAGLTSSEQWQ